MRTRLSANNPYCHSRLAFAWEHVPAESAAHLDFGCHDGAFLRALQPRRVKRLAGIDVCRNAISTAKKVHPHFDIRHLPAGSSLPFADESFSSASLLDVLEHVDDQVGVLRELRRVLRVDGRLIVTVPQRYFLSCLDTGNFKFRFPRAHRAWYVRRHGRTAYEERYARHVDGLIGDVSATKGWHEHFSANKLVTLLAACGFHHAEIDGAGFFGRVLECLYPLTGKFRGTQLLHERARDLDAKLFASMHLFCVAQRG